MRLEDIVVTQESFLSEEPYDIVQSNINYVNSLFDEYLVEKEVSQEALMSYNVDYYLAQVNNGGFSQFVYNSRWHSDTITYVRKGLKVMGANKNIKLFEQSASILDQLGEERIDEYLNSDYFGTNAERDTLSAFDIEFFKLQKEEDLIELNSKWLKDHPKLLVLDESAYSQQMESVVNGIPDREERAQKSLAAEPRYMKLVRALSSASGHELDRVTAGSPTTYKGKQLLAWHFLTNKGHHYMIDNGDIEIMFDGESKKEIHAIEAGSDFDSN